MAREKSVPGLKASRHGLTLLLGADAASDFTGQPCSMAILKNLGPWRIMPPALCLCSVSGTTKPGWQPVSLQRD